MIISSRPSEKRHIQLMGHISAVMRWTVQVGCVLSLDIPLASGGRPPRLWPSSEGWVYRPTPEAPLLGQCWQCLRHFWKCQARVGFGPAPGLTLKKALCHTHPVGGTEDKYHHHDNLPLVDGIVTNSSCSGNTALLRSGSQSEINSSIFFLFRIKIGLPRSLSINKSIPGCHSIEIDYLSVKKNHKINSSALLHRRWIVADSVANTNLGSIGIIKFSCKHTCLVGKL